MIRRVLGMVLLVAVVSRPVIAAGVPASTEASSREVALRIDHSGLLEHQDATAAEETAQYVQRDGIAALREAHGVTVLEDAATPEIVVELGWVDYGQSICRITMKTHRPGEDARALESFECPCIDSGVSEAVLQRLPAALEQLDERPPAAEPAVPTEDEPAAAEEEPPDATPSPRSPISVVGITGAVLAAGGVGALGFGISRWAKGEQRELDPHDEERERVRDYGPQGRAWVGVGAAGVAAGATMLVLDLTVLRRRRRAAPISMGPVIGPTLTGIRIHGRF